MEHKKYLEESVAIAEKNIEDNRGGPFGAVIVKDGEVVGRGWNAVTSENNPTLHAEVMAIEDACKNLGTFSLEGCQVYSSSEPCPMCLGAIYWARLDELYYSNTRKDAAEMGFDDSFIYKEFKLPENERSVKTKHIDMPEAHEVFRKWQKKDDKTKY